MAIAKRSAGASGASDQDIAALLDGVKPDIRDLAVALIELLRREHPELEPSALFGWRSVNFRHPRAGHLCAVFPLKDEVRLYFEHGRLLSDPERLLEGDGKQVRALRLRPGDAIPAEAIGLFMAEAIALKG